MKKIIIAVIFAAIFKTSFSQVKLTSANKFQIGYNVYTPFFIGSYASQGANNGRWALEYYDAAGGLNFWRPWPNTNSGDGFLFLKDNGNVGIGMTNPSYKLDVNGIVRATNISVTSDERLKTNITPLKENISKLILLNGKMYNKALLAKTPLQNYVEKDSIKVLTNLAQNEKETLPLGTKEFGFIAQELLKVYPELVSQDNEGIYSVNYIGLIPVLVEAFKEQQNNISQLTNQINSCCNTSQLLGNANNIDNNEKGNSNNKAILLQNTPNPFGSNTEIGLVIPSTAQKAILNIYDMQGIEIKSHVLNERGQQTFILEGNSLKAGMYLYSLIVDNTEIDTKRMILTK